jgi:hypothetical protein
MVTKPLRGCRGSEPLYYPPNLARFVCRDAPSQAHELCAGDGGRWIISLRQLVGYKLSATIGPTVADAIDRALHTNHDVVAVGFNQDAIS